MNSCLYECSVMHHRFAPKEHHFQHDIFMFYLDLGQEVDVSGAQQLFCSAAIARTFTRSAMPTTCLQAPARSSRKNVLAYLARNGVAFDKKNGRIMLLTLPRVVGYIFNPVSFYFCFDARKARRCAPIAEVGNTRFAKMKLFLIRQDELDRKQTFRKITPKHFYVSPFSSFAASCGLISSCAFPADALEIHIDDRDGDARVLLSTLSGKRAALTNGNLCMVQLKVSARHAERVIFLIHFHALLLYLKRILRFTARPPIRRANAMS